MKPGLIVLFHKDDNIWISKKIAEITESDWTHAGVIKAVEEDRIVCKEAIASGFEDTYYTLSDFEAMKESGSILLLESNVPLYNIEEVLAAYSGRPYGYFDILAIWFYEKTGFKLFKGSAHSLICSEACARFLYDASGKEINLKYEFKKPFSYITPQNLFASTRLHPY